MAGGLGSGCSSGLGLRGRGLDRVCQLIVGRGGGLRRGQTEWVHCDFFLELFQGFIC